LKIEQKLIHTRPKSYKLMTDYSSSNVMIEMKRILFNVSWSNSYLITLKSESWPKKLDLIYTFLFDTCFLFLFLLCSQCFRYFNKNVSNIQLNLSLHCQKSNPLTVSQVENKDILILHSWNETRASKQFSYWRIPFHSNWNHFGQFTKN